jgi:hypothetical protein
MALTPRLDLRQTQSLVMTPQLQQAIKLLALSSLEPTARRCCTTNEAPTTMYFTLLSGLRMEMC